MMDGPGGGTVGRLPNGKLREGKPRLLLMGQRRYDGSRGVWAAQAH